jgi:hypothetical protein
MAGRTGESRRLYVSIYLKTKELYLKWSGSYGDQGYLEVQRRPRKVENVFTQGTWLSHLVGRKGWQFLRNRSDPPATWIGASNPHRMCIYDLGELQAKSGT